MKSRVIVLGVVASLAAALVAGPLGALASPGAQQASAAANPFMDIPISGTFTDAGGGQGTFAGTLNVTGFVVSEGDVAANGLVSGTLTDSQGNEVGAVADEPVTWPLQRFPRGSCDILLLRLGPLDLDLLGLQVHLNRVILTIVADPGLGNLLGNLLCLIAHLLDFRPPWFGPDLLATLLSDVVDSIQGV